METIYPFPSSFSRAESQKDSQKDTPWHDVSTRMPRPESFKAGGSVGELPKLSTDPDPEDEDLSESDDASTITPTLMRKKRKWYRRILDRVLRRGLPQQANASMPNLLSYGVSSNALVSFSPSIREATRSYNSLISPSRDA